MKLFISFLKKKDRVILVFIVVLALLQVWMDIAIPGCMDEITTMIKTPGSTVGDVTKSGVIMFGMALLSLVGAIASTFLSAKIGAAFAMRIRAAVFDKTMDFSMEEMNRFRTSSLITRCTNDVTKIQVVFSAGLILLLKAPLEAVWAISRIYGKNWVWTLTVGVVFLIVIAFILIVARAVRSRIFEAQRQVDNINRVNREHLSGIRVIHAFNAFDYQEEHFGEVNEELFKASRSVDRRTGLFSPFMTSMLNLLNVLIYFVGAFVISNASSGNRLPLFSDMVTFSSYAVLVMSAFVQLLLIYIGIVKAMASWDRVSEVLKSDISIVDGKDEQEDKKDGSIVFENVSFEYPGAGGYALKDINLSIKKGQTVAFIGATGSGKTSILNLIPRFYDATEGRVLVDGKNVRDYRLRDLRNKLGYIPQKSMLFSGSIASNIAYGDNGRFQATLTEIKKASEVGQAKEFIEKKEGGYEAKVAEGGKNFSGGQKQRLTISRAICRDPEIYLFDDSFSALDFKTDRMLRDRLKEVAADATVLIVAQRIGTIMGADCIYVIDKGQIVDFGKHEELMQNCPIYQEIAASQMMERGAAV